MRVRVTGSPADSWRRSSAWTTYVPLDHLRAVGPPGSRNTVVQRNISGPTARKWSKRASRVTTCETPSHHAGRSASGMKWSAGTAPRRARPAPSPRRSGPTDPSLPVRKSRPLPAHRLGRFRWSPGRFRRLFKPISLTTHLIPAVVEINHAAWRRLLRPFPSATPLHPSLYEKKERSKGRRSVVVEKERSGGGGARWWVVENGIVATKDEAELRRRGVPPGLRVHPRSATRRPRPPRRRS